MTDGVFEDIGYHRDGERMEDNTYRMEKARPFVHKKKIRLLKGDYRGEIRVYADEYADDLISRRMAEEVKET